MNLTVNVKFLRHCESEFNADRKRGNIINCALTAKGIEQSKQHDENYSLVILSPLQRAQQTFYFSKIQTKKVVIWYEVREVIQEICDLIEGEIFQEENEKEILERIEKFKRKLSELAQHYQKILVVTHADFIWWLTSKIGEDGERYGKWIDNGDIIDLEFDIC